MNKAAFSLVETLLAITILAGTILSLLAVFTPILAKTKTIENTQAIKNIEEKIDSFIQSQAFKTVFQHTKNNQSFYFHNEKVSTHINEIQEYPIIQATLSPHPNHPKLHTPSDYPQSYLKILVTLKTLNHKNEINKKLKNTTSFITIKNR